MRLLHCIFVLFIALLPHNTHVLTIPTPLSIEGEVECLPKPSPWYSRKTPTFYDCKYALDHLPNFPSFGAFHNHEPKDPFKLPVASTFRTCTNRVELMAGGATQSGSWLGVRTAAERVNLSCIGGFAWPVYVGGWTTMGKQERIVVMLSYSKMMG